MRFLKVYSLMLGAEFCSKQIAFNCDKIVGIPRQVWVDRQRKTCCGGNGQIEYKIYYKDPSSSNALVGVQIDTEEGQFVLDAPTVNALVDACDKCCSSTSADSVVTGTYNGTIPAFNESATTAFCISRVDDGSAYAIQKTNLDYMGRFETLKHTSNTAGTSTYDVTAYTKPKAVGADVVSDGACGS